MEVSKEQKRRIEANRAAAVARRDAKLLQRPVSVESPSNGVQLPMHHLNYTSVYASPISVESPGNGVQLPMQHSNCTSAKASVDYQQQQATLVRSLQPRVNNYHNAHSLAISVAQLCAGPAISNPILRVCPTVTDRVIVAIEICAPNKFVLVVKHGRVQQDFFESVSSVAKCENLEPSAQWPVYNLRDYDNMTAALKSFPGVKYEQMPWSTRMVLEKFQRAAECGVPYGPGHVTVAEVEQLLFNLPQRLAKALLPFQREGVKFGLQRGGRCLIADEMGVGKTIQAIAMASCYRDEGSLLVVCPASMRLVWAEELERWLPYLSPRDVHLVFGRRNNLAESMDLPKVVVISFNMLARLHESMVLRKWGMVIVDEAHNLRCTTKKLECVETMAVLELVQNVKRVALLTGTPSLSRPFDIYNQVNCLWPKLLGNSKYEFAQNYCDHQGPPSGHGNCKDFSRGSRLVELNVLLKQAVMIRRMKDDVMLQLPPKRRQIICLQLSSVDIKDAKAFTIATARERTSEYLGEEVCKCGFTRKGACECEDENGDESNDEIHVDNETASKSSPGILSEQEVGVAKLRGFQEWLLNNSIFASGDETPRKKMIIFAHHLKVLDSIQTIIQRKGVEFVRIDGSTLPRDRLDNVNRFRWDPKVKLAIIGVQAGGVGLDFSAAHSVAFVELPKSASEMLQAEDRAHRRGQKKSVNIYIFVAKRTSDVRRWQSLNMSLKRVSTMTDGTEACLDVERVVDQSNIHLQLSLTQDFCITTDTTRDFVYHSPALSTSQIKNTPDGSAATVLDFPATSLMFEVSSNTGRIHLFLRSSDENNAITSLQENFKPEDLAHFAESGTCERGALPASLLQNASHREIAALFWEEYCNLRPVFQKRLRGRPLSLPLSAELESFKDGDQYIPGGIMKGGSKRRWTPPEEISCKVPVGASWRTVSFHRRNGLKETNVAQAWTAENVPLCKYCQRPCKGPRSMKPELFEDLFCQITCLIEYCNKTSRRHIREELFDLEGGVCVKCNLNCHALVDRIRPLPSQLRRAYILENAPQLNEFKSMLERLIKHPVEGNAWHADHIVAVADGGGECTLENFQTLCFACHAKVTAEQHRRRTAEKLKLKRRLQRTIRKLQEQSERKKRRDTFSTDSEFQSMDASGDEDDQDLLNVKIAGSAYSTFAGSEVLTEQPCNVLLQTCKTERREFSHKASGVTETLPLRACESVLQAASDDDQNLLNVEVAGSACSAFEIIGITKVLSEKSFLQASGEQGRESTQKMRLSEGKGSGEGLLGNVPLRPSGRGFKRSPYFAKSRKKPTFSLESLNKFVLGSV